jgi:hypothetical protein
MRGAVLYGTRDVRFEDRQAPKIMQPTDCRWLTGVFWNMPMCSAPAVSLTASGFQSVKALTGPADHDLHDRQ